MNVSRSGLWGLIAAAYRWSLKLHRRQPSDKLRESLGQGPAKSSTASTFSVWKCVLSTAMVEENSHDLELQKLLSTSKEGTCANAARLKESQGSGDDLITEIIVLRKKKMESRFNKFISQLPSKHVCWLKKVVMLLRLSILLHVSRPKNHTFWQVEKITHFGQRLQSSFLVSA